MQDQRRWEGRSARNSQNRDGNVIRSAAFERRSNQRKAGLRRRSGSGDVGQLAVADQAPKPVSTKDERVSFFQGYRVIRSVRRNGSPRAESSGKNVALGVGLGVFRAHDAGFDQAADVGMIAGQPGSVFAPNMVEAAVAHVSEVEGATDDGQSGTGSAHSVELGMFQGVTLNAPMSGFKGFEQSALGVGAKGMIIDVTHGLDGETAGFLSAFVTAHSVGHDGETAFAAEFLGGVRFPVEIGILVIAALAAYIGESRRLDSGLRSFAVNCHN